ncbi:hypothetical protein KVT40_009384 [Elsinoe batatas]|uniref:FAD-binding FR-type domain-containing protein n=1 Tax=Elsinoe batatas TaxID=2601811 RepID=A0A8K0PDA7_9PEZI|nr:hypothetical protein KVT40_009384 [Elsinoe batatas]
MAAAFVRKTASRPVLKFAIASVNKVKTTFPGSGFTKLVLEDSHMVNHNVKYLRFRLPEGDQQSGIQTITSLLTNYTPDGAWLPVFRPYTPIDADEPGYLSFLVKQYPNGKGSSHMHSLKPGDELKVKPIHEFDYKPNEYSHLTILAGGAGITPFVQLIRRVLVFSNHTEDDILLKSEFDVVSQPASSADPKIHKGHVTRAIIEQALPARAEWAKSRTGSEMCLSADLHLVFKQWLVRKDVGVEKDQVQKF